jgi:hypothetical protein
LRKRSHGAVKVIPRVEVKSPFHLGTCADMPIGCEWNEFRDLSVTLTGGLDTIRPALRKLKGG